MNNNGIISACLLLSVSLAGRAEEPADSAAQARHELREIVVAAERIIHKPGMDVLLLSEGNRDFGVNALEAISSLNYFKTSIGDTELISADNREVYITINGVPAKGTELCGYSADEIKSVEYYDSPPAEFMADTDGPVINVVTRKPVKSMVSGYFSLQNAVSSVDGLNSGTLTYADSLNRVQAFYNMHYSNSKDIEQSSVYEYGADRISDYAEKGSLLSAWHTLDLSYQRDQGNHMFKATLSGIYEHSREKYSGIAKIGDAGISTDGTSSSRSDANAKQIGLTLYYRLKLGNGKLLAFNVVNTLGKSASSGTLTRDVAPPHDALNYDLAYGNDNKTYALSATTSYSMPVGNGNFGASFRYGYNRLNQTGTGTEAKPESHRTNTSVRYAWMKNGFTLMPSLALNTIETITLEGRDTYVSPAFNFASVWNAPKGVLNGWSANLTYSLSNRSAILGNIANSISYIDHRFISEGNPALKPFRDHSGQLSIRYYSPDGRNSFRIMLLPQYAHHPFAPVLTTEGDMQVLRYENIRYSYTNACYVSASWHVLPWLELSPYVDYSYGRYSMSGDRKSFGQWRVGGSITVSKDHFEFSAAFNPSIKQYDGMLFKRQSTQAYADIRYRINNFSVTCAYRYYGQNEYTSGANGEFKYKDARSIKAFAHHVSLTLTYSFSKGKQMQHSDPMLYEAPADNGLGSFNSVVKP